MGKVFVEYATPRDDVGYADRPLNIVVSGRGALDFEPKEEYGGRRVEEFDTEVEAERFVQSRPRVFKMARDIIDIDSQGAITKIIDLKLKGILLRLEALEGKRAEAAPAPKRRPRVKKAE